MDPTDGDARRELLDHIAAAERVAPSAIRSRVVAYREAMTVYLDGLADGRSPLASIDIQREAGERVNEYVSAECF